MNAGGLSWQKSLLCVWCLISVNHAGWISLWPETNPTPWPLQLLSWSVSLSGTDLYLSLYPTLHGTARWATDHSCSVCLAQISPAAPPGLLSPAPPSSHTGLLFLPDRTSPLPSTLPAVHRTGTHTPQGSDTTHPDCLLSAQATAWPRLPDLKLTTACQPCTTYYSFSGCHPLYSM